MVTLFLLTAQTSTNRAQTNGTGLERFRLHGVESDVTVRKKDYFRYIKVVIVTLFLLTAQLEHKRMAPVWIDLDGMGWRVTSLPRIVFVISKKGKYI